jgi:hypothetical protein
MSWNFMRVISGLGWSEHGKNGTVGGVGEFF